MGLTKCYGSIIAVDNISFRVEKGEFFGFLGPNGAGKTTTIRMLTGVIKPDSGTASIMKYDVINESIKAKQVMGVLPELAGAYVDLTAWQNLMLLGELYGVHKHRRHEDATRLLMKMNLYQRRDQLVKKFSKGMKQRLLICMALLNNPPLLFLDEPTVGLDVQSARLIREILQELNEGGTTIFLTTHNMDEANTLCNRVAIINQGRLITIDNPERLKTMVSSLQSVEVAFNKCANINSIAHFSEVSDTKKVGDKFRLYTKNPNEVINQIVDYARGNDLSIITLNVLAPTLEDIFVKLIGNGDNY